MGDVAPSIAILPLVHPAGNESPDSSASGTTSPDTEDRAILREIAAGRMDQFDRLVNRYKTRLFRFIYLRLGDMAAAEDLTQEVFLKVFRSTKAGVGRGTVSTWIFTIASHGVTDHFRARRRRENLQQAAIRLTPRDSTIDPVTAAAFQEERVRVAGWLSHLPDEQREVLSLRLLGDLTVPEIAEVTGAGEATVKARLRYGLAKIAGLLETEKRT